MIDQDLLRDLTESYLKSLISEVSGAMSSDFDSSAPFGELGIDSFHVLKIIRRLEVDFGTLPKSLLFENFNINDLANYFARKYEQVLCARFAKEMSAKEIPAKEIPQANSNGHANGSKPKSAEVAKDAKAQETSRADGIAREAAPIRILQKELSAHPELQQVVHEIFDRYKMEGGVSRGTSKIAPTLFIGSARRGYFNYGRCKNIILVYAFTGPRDYFPTLMEEMCRYCKAGNFQLNIFSDESLPPIAGVSFSATPFGVLQRISNLKDFTLDGGEMRRLRYQVSKFQKSGLCKTEEYRCGSNPETDNNIAAIIDKWCAARTMVNPLVHDVKAEILAGTLPSEHRLFLTSFDGVLQNVILITAMAREEKGYLMDLEFYPPEMPMGGLEFAIVQIIQTLAAEGCNVLSLGGTYGCKLNASDNADPEIDKILDDLRRQNIFNDEGNLQFKNKFRPENKEIFLCRPVGSANPDNVIDIIMMIADPDNMQTPDGESNHALQAPDIVKPSVTKPSMPSPSAESPSVSSEQILIGGDERLRILSGAGFNPLNIPYEHVEFDLKTDSWAQLHMPFIEAQMRHLQAELQQPANVDESLRAIFPFAHFILTASGQEAEHVFFKAWPKKGGVLQNLLFPSTIFHQIDKGFTNKELPSPAVFDLNSCASAKGNMDWEALQIEVAKDPSAIAMVCIEVGNNAAGGHSVSMQHLRDVKKLLAQYSIPLVIDGTRVMENAQLIIEQEYECAEKSIWAIVREIFSHADAVIGSLSKDFCVNKGGVIATNDAKLFHRLQELVHEEAAGIDLIDKKMIALSFRNRKQIEAKVLRRMEGVRRIWRALNDCNVPVVQPAGGHCILIDVKQIPEFKAFKYPVASFLAWLYLNTGIRAAAHSVGMQKQTSINDLVRLAIPVGLSRDQIDTVIDKLIDAFAGKTNIPEIDMEKSVLQPLGTAFAKYKLIKYHNVPQGVAAPTDSPVAKPEADISGALSSAVAPASSKAEQHSSLHENGTGADKLHEDESAQVIGKKKMYRKQDIAIVGMAGRYPKAKNPRELWENLSQGRDCIEEISADRYEWRLQHGSSQKYRGGFIDDVDKFDSLFFNISPREAEMLDPQERLFLEVAWEALEDAGYYPEILAKEDESRNIGVFVGAVWTMYQMLGVEEKHLGNKIVPNSFLWSIANRASYWLNLSGPSLTLDTACSSSLTAIHLACEAIYAGDCSAAIVGGVNLDLHQTKTDINQTGGALSPDGVCRSFGKGANGYVQGEGIGALLLKPLDRAVQDGDNIYGVIKSAVVNHGGRTSGYTVPNPNAQANLILSAFEKADVSAGSIGYIEAHGTGTELGDPVEITGLSNAFSADNVANQTCAIGSIKSNIGHLEAAAGVASVSKVLLQMKHRQLVPSLHSAELNEFIDFKNSPFYVVQRVEDWKPREVDGARLPLRAGISSFGAGGSNAHIILESYESLEQDKRQPAQPTELIFPLSARNEDQLRETAVRLTNFLQQNEIDLNDTAHTLQVGRKSFEHRLAVIARTKEELLEKLALFIHGKKAEDIVIGNIKSAEGVTRLLSRKEKEEFIRFLLQRRDPRKVAELWVEGLVSDWRGLQTNGAGKKISLPTYPFADKRHWAFKKSAIRHSLPSAAGMHPMVDANESTFDRQIFKKTFHERDFFIYDHLVANIPTLPGVAYLELARKAGELAAGRKVQKIRNILWVSPIAVQNSIPKEVLVELKPSESAVKFEVFSNDDKGNKIPHSQGTLLYSTKKEAAAEPEYIDLDGIRARCTKVIDGKGIYPRFKSLGLNLGPSFQVLHEVYKNETEILGALKLPEFRQGELESMVLHPSLVDGSLQAGVGAQLSEQTGDMFVPFSIGEVEVLHPLQPNCFSYVTEANAGKGKKDSLVLKSNVFIVDETGKVLVKIRESVGVPLRDIYKKTSDDDGFTKLYYSYDWEKAPLALEKSEQDSPSAVVLFDTEEKIRDLYQQRLSAAGTNAGQVISVQPGDSFQDCGNQSYKINPQNKDDFAKLFESLAAKQCPVEKICLAWQFGSVELGDDKSVKASLERGVHSLLFVCQALIKQKLDSKVQLLYLYSAKPGETQPHNEAVTGFVNTLRFEHPKLVCKAVEIRQESAGYEQIIDAVAAEFQARTQDATCVRYDAQDRYIRKLKAISLEETTGVSAANGVSPRENGVYLITGGAGGLGLLFAQFLAKNYKAKLVLTGRSRLSAEREAKLEEIRKSGGEALYLPADVSNYEDVKNLVSECKSRFGAIHGIIHSAGVIRDSLIRNKTLDEMSAVFAPKVYGTLHLDEVTKDEALEFFVTFSSLSAVAGNAGQCDYSFANSFMDSFAARREQLRADGVRSGKTLSINWSLWADGGMRPDEQTELYFRKNLGMKPLSAGAGIEAFVHGLASARTQFAMLEGVQEKIEMAWGLRKKPEPAPALPSSQPATSSVSDAKDGELLKRLQNDLSQIVMESLKLDASDVPLDKILLDLGFDSIGLTGYANILNEKYQLDITPVLFFDYPTIGDIAKYLSTERKDEILRFYGGSGAASKSATSSAATQQQARASDAENHGGATFGKGWNSAALDREAMPPASGADFSAERRFVNVPIAIVGMSGVMPESDDVDEFWENLKNSKDMITVIPPDRWRWEDFYGDPLKETNKSNSKWGGFMREVDKFDPLFFGISPREAQVMDPQQRIFIETVWKAIEDSGHKVSDLSGTRTGLFVGVATNDYADTMNRLRVALDGYTASGNSHAVLANRVSFLLNLRGPSAPIDTACSSSLVALHRAIESIHTGSCDMAIVGGVQAMLSPAAYISFSMAGMLSPDGKCKSFDKRANGYVRGEGCGAILIKTLAAAEADGNHIYAVIKATAENHGGKVTTLTAPNSSAQSALLIEAYEKAQIDPGTVGFIECHGTGTSLGDPIEIQALSKAFSELYKKHNKGPAKEPHCGLSSVKTNIGHLETAAGIAGVLKVLLAIKHKQIPANVHFEELNPYINLKGTPFYIADKLTPWEAPKGEDGMPIPRRAGVSSFGFGGANAHIVLEEYIAPKRESFAQANNPQLIVLSAKNEDRLKAYVQSMHAYLEKKEVELSDFAYTLQVGRDEMPERLAMVTSSVEELKQKFEEILRGETPKDSYSNNVRKAKEDPEAETFVQTAIEQKELPRLAELWVSGAKIDWRLLHTSGLPKRISVPAYPFARERYWIPSPAIKATDGRMAAAFLHPLIHRNVSTLEEQKFVTRFSGEEFYLADHVVETQKILPGVAYLEMARAAGELAGDAKVRVIRNLTWERPLIVASAAQDIEVSLSPAKNEIKFLVKTVSKEKPIVHCTGKLAYALNSSEPEVLDIAGIQRRCPEQVIAGSELYPLLNSSGLKLGKSFQIVQRIYANESESLSVLQLPEHLKKEASQFWLHPALMDGSLHTAMGLMKQNGMDLPLSLPYSVAEVQIFHPLQDLYYGYAVWAGDHSQDKQNNLKMNFHLLDKNGKVLVRIKEFSSRPLPRAATKVAPQEATDQVSVAAGHEEVKAHLQSLVPVWDPVRIEPKKQVAVPESARIVLLRGDQAHLEWARKSFPNSQLVQLSPASSIETIAKEIAGYPFDQLLWVAPDVHPNTGGESVDDERIIEQQQEGALAVFRIIKALLHSGYANKKLQWTIITSHTQRVKENDRVQPAHAGVAGLVGSMAKEYPQWDLRLLDLDSLASVTAQECLALPWDKQGNGLAHRQGEWLQQGLAIMWAVPQVSPLYRKNGVYVVIGGAGGLGEVWTRFMMENYDANVVWIGRRKYDAAIEAKINASTRLGRSPQYISADATDLAALEQACNAILKIYPAIHGVVHSAIVLQDQSIARMDESGFRASSASKVDISVNMDKVFGKQELDFMLFFSSVISFFRTAGQSNYSAGCTFKDSFAQKLQQERTYPVKIMNWGYWGSVGIVADESYKEVMRRMGIGSIEPEEGMASLQALVASEMRQMVLLKTINSQATAGMGVTQSASYYPKAAPAVLTQVQQALAEKVSARSTAALEAELPTAEMNDLVTEILASSLISMGLFSNGICRIADLPLDKQPAPYYERWLNCSIQYLQQQNVLASDLTLIREVRKLADLWAEWEERISGGVTNPSLQAQIALFGACLKGLPAILSGKQLATDVMFPNSSMQLVESIYRGNAQADHFNEVLGETLVECIEQQLQADKARAIRILEIGAGTGGTTTKILSMLQGLPIVEYCYTDVSKAFLMYAEKQFKPQFPALTTAIFDVTKPLSSQAIAPDRYDFAIAANVLHATPSIRETLRNAKATLKNQGVLLLNEISNWSLFNHLTFGLLEGWWLHEDTAVRLPGNPGLAPEKWQEILAEEGFESICFPSETSHRFGQQIVAAASNGWVRQRVARSIAQQPSADIKRADAKAGDAAAAKHSRAVNGAASSAELSGQMGNDYIKKIVVDQLSEALQMDSARIRNDAPFADYGVDSIVGVNLIRKINETLEIELETISLFEHSTVDQITQHIVTNWQQQITARLAQVQGSSQKHSHSAPDYTTDHKAGDFDVSSQHRFMRKDLPAEAGNGFHAGQNGAASSPSIEPIAIVGISGRFAESESLEEFWHNLRDGKELIKEVSRWSTTDCVISESNGNKYCTHGSFIDSIDRFDPAFFGISDLEAIYMDPQHRLFLEESWKALEDAGYAGKSMREKQCGVYVGCGNSNYDRLFTKEPPAQAWWGNSQSVAPSRIAYYLNLHGPAIAVDTACSSSLVAMHLACQGLWSQETEMALAGGVYVQATPGFYQVGNRAGMLSPEGKCYSFDARANGFVPGEGVGVVVLKRLQDALQDGDHIYGVITGSGINQNGSSNGIIAPNARAQERLERSVYDRFNINPETIQVVEAHGTASILGDSIEYGAISRAFREYTDKKQFCAIGSVKTNLGHGATAAGVTGVIKLLLALKHRQIPPSLNFQKGNPVIDFEASPFYVNTQLKEWKAEGNQARRAAISAFGFSGTNAHLVIEEAPAIEQRPIESPAYLVALSARTPDQLKQQACNLLNLVKATPGMSMNDLSFSLFVGRMHLSHRLSCMARNQDELVRLLEQWIATGAASQIYTSEIQEGKVRVQVSLKKFGNHCIQECRNATNAAGYLENLAAIADLYIQGYSLDFQALFSRDSKRMPLPTYPFGRERYWVDAAPAVAPGSTAAATAMLHPLLHANTSNLDRQSYSSTFTGTEFFLTGHPSNTNGSASKKVLPEVAYLEMARAAVERAASISRESSAIELRDTVWTQPITVAGPKEVTVSLFANDDEQIDYEICSTESGQEIVYCQGRAVLIDQPSPAPLDIDELQGQMQECVLNPASLYAEFGQMGLHYGPAHQAITAVYQGEKQLLARLSVPAVTATSEAAGSGGGFLLHPSVMTGAMQVGIRLIADPVQHLGAPWMPCALERMCILSPCTEEMFVWVRHSQDSGTEGNPTRLDLELADTKGTVCVQMRGVSFRPIKPTIDADNHDAWQFSTVQSSTVNGAYSSAMGTTEKMELFLKQEAALQLRQPIEKIATNQSYFDLGLTSLGIAHLIQKTNQLLGENLSPSVLFEYRDIQSLAAYLAATCPAKIEATTVAKQNGAQPHSGTNGHKHPADLTLLPRKKSYLSKTAPSPHGQTDATKAKTEINIGQVLEKMWGQEESLVDSYEKVTF